MHVRRPSALWLVGAAVAATAAIAFAVAGYSNHRAANTPIGEGQLFVRDATAAVSMMDPADDSDTAVRTVRNNLRIEAVSYLNPDGVIEASTSPNLIATQLSHRVLAFGLSQGRFVAAAAPLDADLSIDGVVEWRTGDVVYRVLQPTSSGALLLDYNIGELLARRSNSAGVTATSIRLYLAALVAGLLAVSAVVGRGRTARRNRELAREATMMRHHNTELERTNAQLDIARTRAEQALELAEEKNRVRAEFVLMINHELRTPLTAVVTGADLLRTDPGMDPALRTEILQAMVSDGTRLEEMIDQMLAVARIENRGLNLEFVPLPGEDVCRDVISRHPELRHTDHAVQLPVAKADQLTLTQLILSLVDNAKTHGASTVTLECAAGVPFEAQLEVGERPDAPMTFVVSDDGPGIEADFLPRIFEKYEKNSFSSGTGLGLYMARMMVEALGGSIAVTTSPAGTRMAVSVETSGARSPVGA